MRSISGAAMVLPLLPRPRRYDLHIPYQQMRRHHPDRRANQPQRQMPDHDADGDLFP